MWRKGNPFTLLVEMKLVIKENGMEVAQKTKNRTTIQSSSLTTEYIYPREMRYMCVGQMSALPCCSVTHND
jgi:hypothetical protein